MNIQNLWSFIRDIGTQKTPRIVVVSTLLGVLLVWAIAVFLVLDKRQSLLEERRQVLGRVGSAVTSQVQQYFKVIQVFLDGVDHWCARNPDSDPRFDEDFARLLASFSTNVHHQIDIRLYDENGGIFFPPSKSDIPLGNLAQSDFFIAASTQKESGIFVGMPFLTPVMKRWVIPVSFPLHAKPHGISVISAVIPLHTFEELFETVRDKPNGSVTMLRRDGIVMARAPRMDGLAGKSIASGALISNLIKEKSRGSVLKVGDIDGKERLINYESMQDFPLITVVTADLDDILFPSYQYTAFAGVIALSLTLFMIIMAMQALRHLRLVADTHRKLSNEAATDALTGVANRRSLLRFAGNEVLRAQRYGRPLSLLMLDLDRFKEVNDHYGHQWGDEVLKQTAAVIQSLLRGADLLGRYGGEEFTVIMPETAEAEAATVAERIREKIGQISLDTGNGEIAVRVSIGVASLLPEETEVQSLINRADAALYSAKREGRDRVVSFADPHRL
ncbi:MAG: diguanylate cyclase [Sterolibacterium sp.]